MYMNKREKFVIALALAAAAGAAFATRRHHRQRHIEQQLQHGANIKEWENEGGNLAPPPQVTAPLAMRT